MVLQQLLFGTTLTPTVFLLSKTPIKQSILKREPALFTGSFRTVILSESSSKTKVSTLKLRPLSATDVTLLRVPQIPQLEIRFIKFILDTTIFFRFQNDVLGQSTIPTRSIIFNILSKILLIAISFTPFTGISPLLFLVTTEIFLRIPSALAQKFTSVSTLVLILI